LRTGLAPEWPVAPPSEDLDFGWLHQGEAFGLGLLKEDDGHEVVYKSEMAVRVESCTCRLLALTRRCLLYLPDTVVAAAMAALEQAEDPVQLPRERLREARSQRRHWATKKKRAVAQEMLTVR